MPDYDRLLTKIKGLKLSSADTEFLEMIEELALKAKTQSKLHTKLNQQVQELQRRLDAS